MAVAYSCPVMKLVEARRWERLRARGIARFVLIYGGLGWAGLTGLAMVAMDLATGTTCILRPLSQGPIRTLGVYVVGGCLWGALVWSLMEYRWRRFRSQTVTVALTDG